MSKHIKHEGLKNLNVDTGFTMMGLLPDKFEEYERKQEEEIELKLSGLGIDNWSQDLCNDTLGNAETRAVNLPELHEAHTYLLTMKNDM